jgi:hypothetical protein
MTDFLDLLEADLRDAAERRGHPQPRRHRPPKGAFRAIAALAVVALCVIATARVLDRPDDERAAQPTPAATPSLTPYFPRSRVPTVVATEGDPGLLDVMSAGLGSAIWPIHDVSGATADPSLGTVVLYRPDTDGAKELAQLAAFVEKIDELRPITPADEAKLNFDAERFDLIVAYGREREQKMLDDPSLCAPAGGDYKVCLSNADEARFSALVRGDRPVFSMTGPPTSWMSWGALSPDGNSVLLETSNRCEYSGAVVWADGETPLTTGVAQPLGWTTDGRAILWVPQAKADAAEHCQAELPEGLYLVKPGEKPTRVGDQPVEKSLDPRTPEQLTG